MKTKWLIRTVQTFLLLLFLFIFEISNADVYSIRTSISENWFVTAYNSEATRNKETIGLEIENSELTIVKVEYFFDTDPGYGNGTPLEVTTGEEIIINQAIPVNSLTEGIHIFYVRSCDNEGHWSQTLNRIFLKTQLQSDNPYTVTRVEYFFDTDPGYGNGTPADLSFSDNITLENIWAEDYLVDGIHMLYVRAMDEFGQWSQTFHRLILKTQLQADVLNIEEVEYFFDTDPGNGNGIKIDISPGEKITLEKIIPVEELSPGLHSFNVRGKFANNNWGQLFHRGFIKYPSYNLVKVEYYFDDDPGLGNATEMPVTPAEMVIIDDVLPISSLTSGTHTLNVRALSETDKWSHVFSATITVFGGVGIDETRTKNAFVSVYPNPTRGILNLDVNQITGSFKMQVITSNGSVLVVKELQEEANTTIDLSPFPNGIYLLRFTYKDEVLTQQIILSK